jgi:hypothetical protein
MSKWGPVALLWGLVYSFFVLNGYFLLKLIAESSNSFGLPELLLNVQPYFSHKDLFGSLF